MDIRLLVNCVFDGPAFDQTQYESPQQEHELAAKISPIEALVHKDNIQFAVGIGS